MAARDKAGRFTAGGGGGLSLDVTIDAAELDAVLERIESFPTREFMQGLAERALLDAQARFDTKTDPEGRSWKPWSEAYRRRGAPFHSRHTLLHLSGNMLASLQVENLTANSADIVARDIPYASRQNADRQFLGFTGDEPTLADYAFSYLLGREG